MTQIPEGKITDEAVERLRSRLGTFNRPSFYGVGQFNEYASTDSIRHFVQGIGDVNPLWTNHEYARKTKYGEIIAPQRRRRRRPAPLRVRRRPLKAPA